MTTDSDNGFNLKKYSLDSRSSVFTLIASAVLIILGLVLIIRPQSGIKAVCFILGSVAVLYGLLSVVGHLMERASGSVISSGLIKGIVFIVIGILFLVFNGATIAVITRIFGAAMILAALFRLQTALEVKKLGVQSWWGMMIFSLIKLSLGLLLVFNDVRTNIAVMVIFGITMLVAGVDNIVTSHIRMITGKRAGGIQGDIDDSYDVVEDIDDSEDAE